MARNLPSAARSRASGIRRGRATLVGILVALVLGIALLLRFGGDLLVVSEPLPPRADAAVMLDGSAIEILARRAGALRLLEEGRVDHVLISLPQSNVWDEDVPQVARDYIEKTYPPAVADRVSFCVLDATVNSTAEEAVVLERCLKERDWRSVIVVTSNYHTRRARMIWKETLAKASPPFKIAFEGVANADFQPRGWWRKRIYAKTWLQEVTKLVWISVVGIHHWK